EDEHGVLDVLVVHARGAKVHCQTPTRVPHACHLERQRQGNGGHRTLDRSHCHAFSSDLPIGHTRRTPAGNTGMRHCFPDIDRRKPRYEGPIGASTESRPVKPSDDASPARNMPVVPGSLAPVSGLGRFVADRTGRVVAATLIGPVLALAPMIGDSAAAAVPMDLTEDCAPADPGNVFDGTPWPQEQTDLRSAWRFAEEGKGVQIAVIDTGFLPQHPQLQDITSAEYPAATFITVGEVQNTSLTPFNDCVGH